MKGLIRVTDGVEERWVTKAVAEDKATLTAEGYYVEDVKENAKRIPGSQKEGDVTEATAPEITDDSDPFDEDQPTPSKANSGRKSANKS